MRDRLRLDVLRDDGDGSSAVTVIVCQGPPRSWRQGDDAVAAQKAGCVWCRRIISTPGEPETVIEPGNA
jgi:hypothetical protein